MRIAVVLNPAAGGGRMRRAWPSFAAELTRRFGAFDVEETRGPGDASAIAHALAAAGARIVVAAGGDGTVSEVADGLLKSDAQAGQMPALAVIPAGTGSDFARSLGISRQAGECVRQIAESPPRRIDAGRVTFVDEDGRAAVRHFVSVASVGVSGVIAHAVNTAAAKKRGRLSGKALFFLYTLRELMRCRFHDVSVAVDQAPPLSARVALVAVANNPFFGGGMMIAPDARPDDGRLEIVVVHGVSRLKLMKDLWLVYSGSHRDSPSCTFLSGRAVSVAPAGAAAGGVAPLEVDGEAPGRIPATFEILEGALVLRGGA